MSEVQYYRDPELLSPAGNWDCARAAVANGADAIFFGLSKFNARLRAENFTEHDLPELMEFLHKHGVKGFVTMNTLIFTSELKAAEEQLRHLEKSGVDAIIVQDLGLARIARKIAPKLEIHASTQMTITSPEGLEFIDSLFTLERAVLSRELSIEEIEKFSPKDCVPLEVFVHGALCVAYSGQCLTSESLGQRSANRGECAQACRMPYELVVDGETKPMDEVRYLLSPQDLAAVDLIPQLINSGVVSYKIEGRLKSPEYVAAVTKVYRKAIDDAMANRPSTVTEDDRYSLEMTFSRGLSSGWLEGTNHPKLTHGKFGKKRGQFCGEIEKMGNYWLSLKNKNGIPIQAGDGIVFDCGQDRNNEQGCRVWKVEGEKIYLHQKYGKLNWDLIKCGMLIWKTDDPKLNARVKALWKNAKLEPLRKGIDITVKGSEKAPLELHCNGISVHSDLILEKAENRPLDTKTLEEKLGKLGGTNYQLNTLENLISENLILPLSSLNRARRALVEKLDLEETQKESAETYTPSKIQLSELLPENSEPASTESQLSVLCRSEDQVSAALEAGVKQIFADFEDIRRYKDAVSMVRESSADSSIHLATPRIQKPKETGYFKFIEKCDPDGVLIRNLGAVTYFKESSFYKTGDFSLNCANPLTAKILKEEAGLDKLTVSYDLNINQVVDLLNSTPGDWFDVTIHQHMPMFHMEHCVFCTFLSDGKDYTDCGRPCEKHKVQLRDRVGQLHTLMADVGCRNTLFNGRAQTGARFFTPLHKAGARNFRCDFTTESKETTAQTINAYLALINGKTDGSELWSELGAVDRLGVVEGTLAT